MIRLRFRTSLSRRWTDSFCVISKLMFSMCIRRIVKVSVMGYKLSVCLCNWLNDWWWFVRIRCLASVFRVRSRRWAVWWVCCCFCLEWLVCCCCCWEWWVEYYYYLWWVVLFLLVGLWCCRSASRRRSGRWTRRRRSGWWMCYCCLGWWMFCCCCCNKKSGKECLSVWL